MTAQRTFEDRLASAFDEWADEAAVGVDSMTLAAVVADGASRPRTAPRLSSGLRRSSLALAALLLLLLALLASVAVVGSILVHQQHRYDGFYETAPDMSIARDQPILVALRDGTVLIAGGQLFSPGDPTALELFDPATGIYAQLGGDIPVGDGMGVQLRDGRVFLVATDNSNRMPHAYVIDVALGVSHELPVPGVALHLLGVEPSIVRLQDDRVLVTGGNGDVSPLAAALLFNPVDDSLTQTGSMNSARLHHAMTLLPDGSVLVAGGISGHMLDELRGDAEIYDPHNGLFTLVGAMPTVRGGSWAMTRADGQAMVIHAGLTDSLFGEGLAGPSSIDLYDPASTTFTDSSAPSLPGQASYTALPDGRVLMAGSQLPATLDASAPRRIAWSAIYDPIAGTVTSLGDPRAIFPSGAVLPDGQVVLAGGYNDSGSGGNPAVPWVEVLH